MVLSTSRESFSPQVSEEERLFSYLRSPANAFKGKSLTEEKMKKLIKKLQESFGECELYGCTLPLSRRSKKGIAKESPHRILFGNNVEGRMLEVAGKKLHFLWSRIPFGDGSSNKIFDAYAMSIGPLALRSPKDYLSAEKLERWKAESAIHEKIRHLPEVVRLHGTFINKQDIFLQVGMLLERCDFDLYEFLTSKKMTEVEKEHIFKGALQALVALHREGLCHGDLNLGNFLIRIESDGNPQVLLGDFEGACPFAEKRGIGRSPPYQSPEQFLAPEFPMDARALFAQAADSFSIGVIGIYVMKWPSEGTHPLVLYKKLAIQMFECLVNLKEVEVGGFSEYKEAVRAEWKKQFPAILHSMEERNLSCLYGEIFKAFQNKARETLTPFLDHLEKSESPFDSVIGKLLRLDPQMRITPEVALSALTKHTSS